MGAAISNKTIAIVYGKSFLPNFASELFFWNFRLNNPNMHIPDPAPIYRNEAIIIGGRSFNSNLEIGELVAYNAAANMA